MAMQITKEFLSLQRTFVSVIYQDISWEELIGGKCRTICTSSFDCLSGKLPNHPFLLPKVLASS